MPFSPNTNTGFYSGLAAGWAVAFLAAAQAFKSIDTKQPSHLLGWGTALLAGGYVMSGAGALTGMYLESRFFPLVIRDENRNKESTPTPAAAQ